MPMTEQPQRENGMLATMKSHTRAAFRTPAAALRSGVVLTAILAVVLVVAFRACAPSSQQAGQRVGKAAIAFTLPAEQAGQILPAPATFTPNASKPTLLIFFYTLCSHCLLQMQAVHSTTENYPALREIYIDSPAELPNLPDLMMQRLAITDPVLLDTDGKLAASYGIAYYPAMVLVDGHGIIRDVWTGEVSTAVIRDGIAQTLASTRNGQSDG